MNYIESKVYLDDISKYGSVLGLENMIEMMERLGNPQDGLKFIHISGTNGKGSVLAYISTVLHEQGYQVGRYISPTLFSYLERIQVGEKPIAKEDFARLLTKVRDVVETMVADGKTHPTIFEIETAVSFLYFMEMNCDYVVLETGLGGLEDATNIVKTTILEVITSISMDHMGFLGDTLEEIAVNKAGIIKPNTTVVSQAQEPGAMKVIEAACRERECKLYRVNPSDIKDITYGYDKQKFSYQTYDNLEITLVGTYQISNGALALEAIKALRTLGVTITEQSIYLGMKKTKWDGRFTVLSKEPVVVIDGAHNEAAAKELAKSIKTYFDGRSITYIMGVFEDKEYKKMIQITAPYPKKVITVQTPEHPRALPAVELAKAWKQYNPTIICNENLEEAVRSTIEQAEPEDVIIAFGSLSFLGNVKEVVEEYRQKDRGNEIE